MTIRKSIRVDRSPETVFRVFTQEIGRWWPLKEGFTFGRKRTRRSYETMALAKDSSGPSRPRRLP